MLKLTRHFATRLRGVFVNRSGTFATSTGTTTTHGSAVCELVRLHLTSAHAANAARSDQAGDARERELATEGARRLITFVGQNGSAVAHCLGAFDAETLAGPAGMVLLHLAERVGDSATRRMFAELGMGA